MKIRTPALALLAFASIGLAACASTKEENMDAPPESEPAPAAPADDGMSPPADTTTTPPPADPTAPPAGTP